MLYSLLLFQPYHLPPDSQSMFSSCFVYGSPAIQSDNHNDPVLLLQYQWGPVHYIQIKILSLFIYKQALDSSLFPQWIKRKLLIMVYKGLPNLVSTIFPTLSFSLAVNVFKFTILLFPEFPVFWSLHIAVVYTYNTFFFFPNWKMLTHLS